MTRGQDTGRVDRGAVNGAAGRNGAQAQDHDPPAGEAQAEEIRVLHYSPDESASSGGGAGDATEPEPGAEAGAEDTAVDHEAEQEPEQGPEPEPVGTSRDGSREAPAGALVSTGAGRATSTALVRWIPDEEERRRWPLLGVFGVGLLVGALLLALVWGTTSLISNRDTNASAGTATVPAADQPTVLGTETSRPSGQASQSAPASPVSAAAAGVTTAQACAQVVAAQGKALKAAGPAMDQWAVHIGAMNKLVVGAITLAQANAFWAQTRLGAMTKIHEFQVADDHARSLTVACPPATLVDDSAVAGCARRAGQQADALAEARTAVRTWKHHVRAMEMLRMGHLSPAAATKMWLASWHKGVDQLRAYQRAAHQVSSTCTA
jgi:hypothetical protein